MGSLFSMGEDCSTPYKNIYEIPVNDVDGNQTTLAKFQGKPLIIVNVASQCGTTERQYAELVQISKEYVNRLEVLAFPCNQFMSQEPGSIKQVCEFINSKGGQNFHVFNKVFVNGKVAHPLFKFLRANSSLKSSVIGWNFGKFLITQSGAIAGYYGPRINPLMMKNDIEKLFK